MVTRAEGRFKPFFDSRWIPLRPSKMFRLHVCGCFNSLGYPVAGRPVARPRGHVHLHVCAHACAFACMVTSTCCPAFWRGGRVGSFFLRPGGLNRQLRSAARHTRRKGRRGRGERMWIRVSSDLCRRSGGGDESEERQKIALVWHAG